MTTSGLSHATSTLDHRRLYRMPWTLPDNVIAWLEPTTACNLRCAGCYRADRQSFKDLAEIRHELDVFEGHRRFDAVSIAGGEPLLHPELDAIVAEVARRGHKPVVNTNGVELDEPRLRRLKAAGLAGVTLHVDSKQGRPGWEGADEVALNRLRLELAQRVARVGGLTCAFNATVYEDTLEAAPDLVEWAAAHVDLVHVMVLICYREVVRDGEFDYHAGGRPVDISQLVYSTPVRRRRSDITSREVVATIRRRVPDFAPCAYLNGTEAADALKWLVASRIGRPGRILGYLGPKVFELGQVLHHLRHGRYFAYAPPASLRRARWLLAAAPIDRGVRRALGRWLRDPAGWFRRLHLQSVTVIQPADLLADGRASMCDGCPDLTVHEGELVWSCRLEERTRYGRFLDATPKPASAPQQ